MKPRCWPGIVSILAVLTATTLAFGSSNAGVITSSGAVALNGKACPTTTALFSGDKVVTAAGGVATISSPGSTVLIPSDSQIVYQRRSDRFDRRYRKYQHNQRHVSTLGPLPGRACHC